ncbi:MAG: LmeA family phospholipid-binding protein [Actinomycetota bacterium]
MLLVKMAKRAIIIMLGTLTVLYGVAEVAAKKYGEKALAQYAAEKDPLATNAQAQISFPIIFGILSRNTIDRVEISTNHVEIRGIVADKTTAVLTGVHLDRAASLRDREPVIESIDRLDMSIEIRQEELSKRLPQGLGFVFTPGIVTLTGPGFAVEGSLKVTAPGVIDFDGTLPRGLKPPSLDLGDLPFVTCIREINIGPGVVTITCSLENPPSKFPP